MSWIFLDDEVELYDVDIEDRYEVVVPIENKKAGKVYAARGKILYSKGDFQGALNAYSVAIAYYYDEEFLARMLCNRAMVHLKKGNSFFAYIDATESLKLDQKLVKAFYRQGKALTLLGFYSKAMESYKSCLELSASEMEVANELIAIEEKTDNPKIDAAKLTDYDPLEADSPDFGRECLTGMLNRIFVYDKKLEHHQNLHLPPLKYDQKSWKSAEDLLLLLFLRALVEIKNHNYGEAAKFLQFAIALDYKSVVGLFKRDPPWIRYAPNPGLGLLYAECCLRSGSLSNAMESAFLAKHQFQLYHELVMEIWSEPPGALWPIYSSVLSDVIICKVAVKSGCYQQAKFLLDEVKETLGDIGHNIWGTEFDLPYVDELMNEVKELEESLKDKQEDKCIETDVRPYLELRLGIAKTNISHLNENGILKISNPMSKWNVTEYDRLAHKLYYDHKAAFQSIFDHPMKFVEAELQAIEENGTINKLNKKHETKGTKKSKKFKKSRAKK
uniref:Uncharacterized protein n=1 Tax=Acrobeloides nanus TaxID=290746 RepID=A0A914DCJ2_9BILA